MFAGVRDIVSYCITTKQSNQIQTQHQIEWKDVFKRRLNINDWFNQKMLAGIK